MWRLGIVSCVDDLKWRCLTDAVADGVTCAPFAQRIWSMMGTSIAQNQGEEYPTPSSELLQPWLIGLLDV